MYHRFSFKLPNQKMRKHTVVNTQLETEQRRNPTVSEKGDFKIELSNRPYVMVRQLQSASSVESIA